MFHIFKNTYKLFFLPRADGTSRYTIARYILQFRQYAGQSFSTSQKYNAALPSPQEVTTILRTNEFNKEFASGSVKSYDSNQLASNNPIEDTRSEALCNLSPGMLMGIFDGHGGAACANVLSKRMLNYIAASLLPKDIVKQLLETGFQEKLLETINDRVDIVRELKAVYDNSFKTYLKSLLEVDNSYDIKIALENAFLTLDSDLSKEVVNQYKKN